MADRADERWMRECIELARLAEGRTAPNPMVGSVIVDAGGHKVAEGTHARAGDPHAEAVALATLGGSAEGCTLYVNLEPCSHQGRTPPCAPLLANAKLARVVVGTLDPIAEHAGGAAWLRGQGLEVETGVLQDECRELNRGFFSVATLGRPAFALKAAISLDGKVATRTGESRWITSEAARADGHLLRNRLDGIMVGIGTVLADDPQLTVRGVESGRDPVRIIVDSGLRTPLSSRLLPANSRSKARVIIATTPSASPQAERALCDAGATVLRSGGRRVDLAALAQELVSLGLLTVLVEGGPTLHASLLKAGLADELVIYVAPRIIGGAGAPSWVAGEGVESLAEAFEFKQLGRVERFGPDLRLVLRRR